MLDHPTLDHLKALRLDGMAEAFAELQAQDAAADFSHAEWLGLLVDREVASRETKRFEARMRSARLRHVGACCRNEWADTPEYAHSDQEQMCGKRVERDRRVAAKEQYACPGCRAKGSCLIGSDKQVAWAEDIKAAALPRAEALHAAQSKRIASAPTSEEFKFAAQVAIDTALAEIRGRTFARQWIDCQDVEYQLLTALRKAVQGKTGASTASSSS